MSEKLNIHQRIIEVRKAVDYIQKQKAVEGYKAVTHDQVTGMLREHLIKHGITTVIRLVNGATVDTGTKTSKGTPIVRFEAVYELDLVNIDDPKDRETYSAPAHANDHGDKAPGKTASYGVKTLLLKAFNIETGENDESRFSSDADEVDTIVKLDQAMRDAETIDDLRVRLKEALVAVQADAKQLKRFTDLGTELAKKFPATIKQPKAIEPEASTQNEPVEAAPPVPQKVAAVPAGEKPSKGLIDSITKLAEVKGYKLSPEFPDKGLTKAGAAQLLKTVTEYKAE